MSRRKQWMSDDQWECALLFADVVGGFHHIDLKIHPFGRGIKINSYRGWATYDNDRLTCLVIRAHDEMIRVELCPSGPGMIGFALWKRRKRNGSMFERHPTILDAVNKLSKLPAADPTPTTGGDNA